MDQLTETIARLIAAVDTAGANLFALESEASVALLDGAVLAGQTREMWDEAKRARATLWAQYGQLTDLLADVTRQRAGRSHRAPDRDAALLARLTTPSVAIDAVEVPLAHRSLLSAEQATTRCSPDELLTTMAQTFDRIQGMVAAASAVWETMVPRLAAARLVVEDIGRDSAELGGFEPALGEITRELDRVATLAASDPLSLDPKDLDRAEAEIAMLRRDTDDVLTLRREYGRRLGEASELLRDIEAMAEQAVASLVSTRARIVPLDLPSAEPADPDELARRLRVIRNETDADWRRRGADLAGWFDDAERHHARASRVVAACHDALAIRDELRGRLDAYRAVAHANGFAEDAVGHEAYVEARDALFQAPTDLDDAARLVAGYQRAIAPSRTAPGQSVPEGDR